jgi:hypothetical protein
METALLRLFNAVYVEDKRKRPFVNELVKRQIENGYILSPMILATPKLLDTIEEIVGISGEKANASFHKSWSVIKDSPIEILVLQQVMHYITTYGYEALGVFSNDTVYIPAEVLNVPEVKDNIALTVIKAMDVADILDNIMVLAGSGIALSKETLDDIMTIVQTLKFHSDFINGVKNRELKALLYDFYNLAPSEPVEYLRYVIGKLTGESLLIKNSYLITKIKAVNSKDLDNLLKLAPKNLASIFLRFKPLFLAMKSVSANKSFFNRLRKQASYMHEPMPEDYLNTVTSKIVHKDIKLSVFKKNLENATIFRKIRLAYALNSRLSDGNSIVYKVRNGRGWATDYKWMYDGFSETIIKLLDLVVSSIASDMSKSVAGKTILIPSAVHYSLPATEKQFLGNIPSNSYVSVPHDLVIGVHWTDTSKPNKKRDSWYGDYDNRVDLDLSLISLYSKYGWDSYYRSTERDILFSGDMTSAPLPNGASEFFYVKNMTREAKLLYVNYFNFREEGVSCKLIVANEKVVGGFSGDRFRANPYMVDVNNILLSTNVKLTKKQNLLAMIVGVDGENRVYFTNTSIGDSITSKNDDVTKKVNDFMCRTSQNVIELKDVLEKAGATIVSEKPVDMTEEDLANFIDLSPENLDKSTIIKLLL